VHKTISIFFSFNEGTATYPLPSLTNF